MSIESKLLLAIRWKRLFDVVSSGYRAYSEADDAREALIDLKDQALDVKETCQEMIDTWEENKEPSEFEQYLETLTKRFENGD